MMHSAAIRRSLYSDPWGRYYTDGAVGRALVSSMTVTRPTVVLDLGTGHGALAEAARHRWKKADVIGVESDPEARVFTERGNVVLADALDPLLDHATRIPLGSVQAAISNPPFIRPKWRPEFAVLVDESGLGDCYAAIEEAGAAVLFLAQILRFLRPGGQAGLILPDGLLSGSNHRALREHLLSTHYIRDAIELPRNAFAHADVKTHILVLQKGGQRKGSSAPVRIRTFSPTSGFSSPLLVEATEAADRLDYSYYARRRTSRATLRLRDVVVAVERGRTPMHKADAFPQELLHTTSIGELRGGAIRKSLRWTPALASAHGTTIASPGDILIARVGRNHHNQVALLQGGQVAISDCIYRVQVLPAYVEAVYRYLASPQGGENLAAAASGSGARHLSKAELLDLPLPIQL